jgi:hypothetical protein
VNDVEDGAGMCTSLSPLQHTGQLFPLEETEGWDDFLTISWFLAVLGIRDILVRIRTSEWWIRIQIRLRIQLRIRLFSSVTLRMPKKIFFIFFLITYSRHIIFSLKVIIFAKILC